MTQLQSTGKAEVVRLNRPSYSEFVTEYLIPRKAVVISGALEHWKACQTWSPEYFKERYGSMPLKVEGQNHTMPNYMPTGANSETITMSKFIDHVKSSSKENPAPYLRNVWIEKFIPELLADIDPMPEYFLPNWLEDRLAKPLYSRLHGGRAELYIGGRGGKFPVLHYDSWHIHTFLCQVYGTKEYTLFPPDQGAFLYRSDYHTSSISVDDIDNVDLKKYPLFAKATPIRLLLQPGEILVVPAGWWHMARIVTPSITVSVSRVNSTNWNDFARELREVAPAHLRPLVWAYLTSFRAIRALSDSEKS